MIPQARLVVLISGFGSNLQAILDAIHQGTMPAQVMAVVSNKGDAYGLERARSTGVPAVVHPYQKAQARIDYDRELADIVSAFQPDWVVLAGWMRLLSCAFLQRFPNRVINLHPALPGMFPGTHAIERAFQAFQAGQIDHTGVMVHLVPDEGIDNGPVLGHRVVPIRPTDTLEILESRVHSVEADLLVTQLRELILSHPEKRIPENAQSDPFRL
jgi:formyltetrahydrofolate-dependent phosphoribosylglycinamide formyltransferase